MLLLRHFFGLKFKGNLEGVRKIAGLWELIAEDPFTLFEGEEWFNNVKKRMDYEEGTASYIDSGFKFLPRLEN